MLKKTLAVGLLAVLAIFAVPAAASAASYGDTGTNAGTVVVISGQSATLTFCGFQPGEKTIASAPDGVTFGGNGIAGADGCVTYTATSAKAGSYTITVTGASNISTGILTVTPADSSGGNGSNADGTLPNTGLETPMLIVWGAAGALALGVALVFVLNVVRRNKQSV